MSESERERESERELVNNEDMLLFGGVLVQCVCVCAGLWLCPEFVYLQSYY